MNALIINRISLLFYTFLIFSLSLINLNHEALPDFSNWDKIQHALAYIGFALLSAAASNSLKQYIFLLCACLLFGALIEYLQGLTAYRTASLADALANSVGLLIGAMMRKILQSKVRLLSLNK